MSKRRTQRRQPRMSGAASKCVSIMPDGSASFFTPRSKEQKGISVVTLESGELIMRISDLK